MFMSTENKMLSAAGDGDLAEIRRLVKRNPVSMNSADSSGWTPLNDACRCGHLSVVRYLVKKGAKVDVANKYGWTPLHLACVHGELRVARYLVEKGAMVNVANKAGWTPVHKACRSGHLDVVRYLVEMGAEVDVAGEDGYLPLHVACRCGHLNVVRCLVEKGAKMDVASTDGWTPLHVACIEGRFDVVRYLVDKGARVDVTNRVGWTPLHKACRSGHLDVVRYLVGKGAKTDATSFYGWTPLHKACDKGHLNVVRFFVEEKGAKVDVTSKDGWTPLGVACSRNRSVVVKFLHDFQSGKEKVATNTETQPAALRLVAGRSAFVGELWKPTDKHIVFKLKNLAPLVSNVHEMKLYYTYVRLAGRLFGLDQDTQKKYIHQGLRQTRQTTHHPRATALYKIILDHALAEGMIHQIDGNLLGDEAVITHMANARFVQDTRQELAELSMQVNRLENRVGGLEHRVGVLDNHTKAIAGQVHYIRDALHKTQQAIQRREKTKSATSLMCGILNAVSMGIVGSVVQGAVSPIYDFCVDFCSLEHLSAVINVHGQGYEKAALTGAMQTIAEVPAFLASEDVSEMVTESVTEELLWRFEEKMCKTDGTKYSIQYMVLMANLVERMSSTSASSMMSSIADEAPNAYAAYPGVTPNGSTRLSIACRLERCEQELGVSAESKKFVKRLHILEKSVHGEGKTGTLQKRVTDLENQLF